MLKQSKITFCLFLAMIWVFSSTMSQDVSASSTFIYSPFSAEFNNVEEKGNVNFLVSSSSLHNVRWPNLRLSFSPINKVSLGLSLFSVFVDNSNFPSHESKLISTDIAYYRQTALSEKIRLLHEIGIGYGQGKVSMNYRNSTGLANMGVQRYYLNIATTMKWRKVGIGLALKPSYINFYNKNGFGEIGSAELEKINYAISNSPALFIDLNCRIEFGPAFTKFFIGFDNSFFGLKDDTIRAPDYFDNQTTSIGVYLCVDEAIKNIKKK